MVAVVVPEVVQTVEQGAAPLETVGFVVPMAVTVEPVAVDVVIPLEADVVLAVSFSALLGIGFVASAFESLRIFCCS